MRLLAPVNRLGEPLKLPEVELRTTLKPLMRPVEVVMFPEPLAESVTPPKFPLMLLAPTVILPLLFATVDNDIPPAALRAELTVKS